MVSDVSDVSDTLILLDTGHLMVSALCAT